MKWIPCSERLPREYSDDERVLATTDVDGLGVILIPIYDVVSWYRKGYISAWMPLPKPYEADRKTEPQYSEDDMYWLSLAEDVANGKMSDAGANQAWLEYINHKTEPTISKMEQVGDETQTEKEECPFDDSIPCEWVCPNSTDCAWK